MGALDRIIRSRLSELEELLSHSTIPVGPESHAAARTAVVMGQSPAYAQAAAKGLSLDPRDIEDRARALGFDFTGYHGTRNFPFHHEDAIDRPFSGDPTDYDFPQLQGRPIIAEDPDTSVSRYLGPHISQDPQIAEHFAGYEPETVIHPYGTNLPSRVDSGGRVIPLRFRGSQYQLPQKWLRGHPSHDLVGPGHDDDPIFDDLAVDIDATTHALASDPEWLTGTRFSGDLNKIANASMPDIRRYVQARHLDLNPISMVGYNEDEAAINSDELERLLDTYRGELLGRGHSVIRYRNTVPSETMYAPSENSFIVLDPSRVRSGSAVFDPDLAHLGGLSYEEGGLV